MMQLFINAGGKGTRLYPLTKEIPKPMVRVIGKPVLEHIIEWAKMNEINEVIIMSGYKSEQIEDYFGDGSKFGISITHSIEPYPLGSGGSIKLASKYAKGTFCYINGDNICNVNLKNVFEFHKKNKADLTAVLIKKDTPYGDFLKIDEKNNVTELILKESGNIGNLAHAGLGIIEPKVLEIIDKEIFNFEQVLFPKLIEERLNFKGYVTEEFIEDMGTPERLKKVEEMLRELK
ncbi:MAG: NDP-sugar synthase [Nanoarchaeota archaeon]